MSRRGKRRGSPAKPPAAPPVAAAAPPPREPAAATEPPPSPGAELPGPAAGSPPPAGWTWRAALLRAAALAWGCLAAVLLAEACLWLFDVRPPQMLTKRYLVDETSDGRRVYHCYTSNPHGEFAAVPDVTGGNFRLMTSMLEARRLPLDDVRETPWCVRYELNALRLRERELTSAAPSGKLRVLLLGDSFVFGEGVPADRTLGAQLGQQGPPHVEWINAGRPGFGTAHELDRLRQLQPTLGITRVVLVFTANDVELTPELAARQKFINDLINIRDEYLAADRAGRWYSGHSRLMALLGATWDMRRITQGTIDWYCDSYDAAHNAAHLRVFAERLRALATWPNVRVLLVLYPLMEGLEGNYPLAPVHQRVREMALAAGLPVLDLAPFLSGQSTRQMWVHSTDHHPNGRAQRIAAEALLRWCQAQPDYLSPPSTPLPP